MRVIVWAGLPELRLQLEDLPGLTELELWGGASRVSLQASRPAPQLRRLTCAAGQAAVSFAALPGLSSASLSASLQLEDAASLAYAPALTRLDLWGQCEWTQSALEVLRCLPPSVRCLELLGSWPQAAMDLVGGMSGIVGLQLDYRSMADAAPLPAAGAPLWAHLRALSCCRLCEHDEERDLPEVRPSVLYLHPHRRAVEVLELVAEKPQG